VDQLGDVRRHARVLRGAVNTEEIPKAVAIGVMTVANVCTGGLQIAETMIHDQGGWRGGRRPGRS
jgi:hypothetical protein